jgi:hypothetical protein
MFVRVKRSGSGPQKHEYLQIVESVRSDGTVRQRVIATLGRRDQLVADGTLDALLQSLAKFSAKLRVVERVRTDGIEAHHARSWGPALVFERLWNEQGVPEILGALSEGRRFGFDIERACFALALQRLCDPGSDLQGSRWLRTVACRGFESLELQHLYRTVGRFLSPVRARLEQELFARDRDLFTQKLDLVFIDTTSTMIWRDEQTPLRRRGHSKDHRPDQPQVILCVAVDAHGWPIAWEILPGNTSDHVAFAGTIAKLRERFNIGRVIVVADRGMISKKSIEMLQGHPTQPLDFILGCRMRNQKEVRDLVLSHAGPGQYVADNLEVQQVSIDGRRYVICTNPLEARKDAAARAAIIAKLETTLHKQGQRAVVGNKGFSRFMNMTKGAISINQTAIEDDARYDGKFVLRTNTELSTDEVARAYKSLWRVERTFRETKSTIEVRPLFHHRDDTTIGHIVGCFLALRLEVDLQRRLDERQIDIAWPDLMRDLAQLHAVDVTLDEQRYRLRTELVGAAHHAFAAAGVRVPPALTALGPAPPRAPNEGATV